MFRLIKRVVKAPLSYIADLRKITFKKYLLLHTNFSPSYPIMMFASLTSTLALAIFIIYNLFTLPEGEPCLEDSRIGAYIMSILYPLETILFFICITGSIALSRSNCWKTLIILLFGPMLSGFGFGQLAFIQSCLLSEQNPQSFQTLSIFKEPSFISVMVYLYLSFIVLYFILVPSIEFLYRRQKEDESKEIEQRKSTQKTRKSKAQEQDKVEQVQVQSPGKGCCSRFLCIIYYILHIIFAISVCFILLIKLIGPILFTYMWIEIASDPLNYSQANEKKLFALSLLSYFGPLGIIIIVLGIQRIVRLGRKQPDLDDRESQLKDKNTIDLTDQSYRSSKDKEFDQTQEPRRKQSSEYKEQNSEARNQVASRRNSMKETRISKRQALL